MFPENWIGCFFERQWSLFFFFNDFRLLFIKVLILMVGASLVAQSVKNLPAVQESRVQSLGWEDPPEKGMATHSSILAWRVPWTEEPGGLQSMGRQESDTTKRLTHTQL